MNPTKPKFTPAKDHKYFKDTRKAKGLPLESERYMQKQLCQWIKLQYPHVRFISTLNGEKLSPGQAAQVAAMQSDAGVPDMIILSSVGGYMGLALELKKEGASLTKRNGEWASEHIAEQADYLEYLRGQGWKAEFAVGFDQATRLINEYMKLNQ